jgi:L-fucose isomerase
MRGDDEIEDEERSQGLNALLGGTAGQRYWTDWLPNFDFTEALLTSTFDWNGFRAPIVDSTEDDGLNGMCMQFAIMLTAFAALFADLRTYWSVKKVMEATSIDVGDIAPTGFLHLINSGPAALDWATDPGNPDQEERMKLAIQGTEWHPAELGYFPKDGLSTHFCTPGDLPVTMLRLNRVGLDLTLTVVQGHTIALPPKVYEYVRGCTNPTWPDTFVVPDGIDAYDLMNQGIDPNHVAVGIGHFGAEARLLASMLRIPVDYTDVPDREVLLPTLWTRLGSDREACRTLGPRYA